VRVTLRAERAGPGEARAVPLEHVHLGWARAGLAEEYSPERRVPFRLVAQEAFDVWEGSVARHKQWEGAIERMVLTFDLPPSPPFKPRVVRSWDFNALDKGQWAWAFFGGADKGVRGQGALRMTRTNGPAAAIQGLGLAAADVTHIVVQMTAELKDRNGVRPVALDKVHAYWARAEDVEADDQGWPFTQQRAVRLRALDPDRPDTLVGDLASHPDWNGQIEQMFVGMDFPLDRLTGRSDHFCVYTQKIALLESRGEASGANAVRIVTRQIDFLK